MLILPGPGSYARMKLAMNAHVDQERHVMFQQSADEARRRLMEMAHEARERMSDRVDELFVAMRRDYRAVLGGGETKGEVLPKSQRLLRKEIMTTLEGVERIFKRVLSQATEGDWEDDEDKQRLMDVEENYKSDPGSPLFHSPTAADLANQELKSEERERQNVPLHEIPGPAPSTEGKPGAQNLNRASDGDQGPSKLAASPQISRDEADSPMLGSPEPQHYVASDNDEDFNPIKTRGEDEEGFAVEQDDDEMKSTDSFPLSDF
jgi:hypothetical protein